MYNNNNFYLLIIITVFLIASCDTFLDVKPDRSLVIIGSLKDCQALLDSYSIFGGDPAIGEVSSDDYYLNAIDWSGLTNEGYKRAYIWEKDGLFQNGTSEWLTPYRQVYWSNIVLETLATIERTDLNADEWDNIKGQALFMRARAYQNVANIWAMAYEKDKADQLGIPLRIDADFNKISKRVNLEETYREITEDLIEAASLLPDTAVHVFRASKAAAYGLLARTYLLQRNYTQCEYYASKSLEIKNTLLEYHTLNNTSPYPVPQFNPETIHYSYLISSAPLNTSIAKVDTLLLASYQIGDLRRQTFFRSVAEGMTFKGSYTSSNSLFSGIAVDEVMLMQAECLIRLGQVAEGLDVLNKLLVNRWEKDSEGNSTFMPNSNLNEVDALDLVLSERRKELVFRGIRWSDIKRLNLEGSNISLIRKLDGKLYDLPANDPRFALPIPEDIVELTGFDQN